MSGYLRDDRAAGQLWYVYRTGSRVLSTGWKKEGQVRVSQKVPLSHWAHTHQLTVWGSCPMLPEVRE